MLVMRCTLEVYWSSTYCRVALVGCGRNARNSVCAYDKLIKCTHQHCKDVRLIAGGKYLPCGTIFTRIYPGPWSILSAQADSSADLPLTVHITCRDRCLASPDGRFPPHMRRRRINLLPNYCFEKCVDGIGHGEPQEMFRFSLRTGPLT